jgi:release factor glutamine methyltransferase
MIPSAAVRAVAGELEAAGVPDPRVDAELLVAHVAGTTRSGVYALDAPLSEAQRRHLRALVGRRRTREPLAYVLGEWGFRRLTLAVDRRALVPRPETETVVERCLAHLRGLERPEVVEVGVGSGAIALALVDEHAGVTVTATDVSEEALALAEENRLRAGVDGRVRLVAGHYFARLAGPFDLCVSNPPYVTAEEVESLQPEVRLYEPRTALVGEGVTEAIAAGARDVLRPGGWLVLECGDGQAATLAETLAAFGYLDVTATPDLAGRDRVVEGRRHE